ncbi:MAG TPA: ABC transporter ATP-binding protein [Thermoleophilia bacterium]|nr:ABC transporter ATP-binding protein [Thermoleophilia bacterium]
MAERLLAVQDLSTHFFTHAGVVRAVNGVSFTLDRGETLGIVGESGSGKTVAAMSILRLIPDPPGKVVEGSIMLGDRDLRTLDDDAMRGVRGNDIAMIFQDPMTSLNPVMKVGKQIGETIRLHQNKSKAEAWQMAVDLLARVGIPDADKRASQYPFEFSGGMRQRAMIAMAISCNPDVLIADEPTTALDVTIQAQIIEVVLEMQTRYESGVILITHDLGVIAEMSDKVMVMYGGHTVEYGPVDEIFYNAHHPYTWGLLASLPRLDESEKSRLTPIQGQPPNLITLPAGCPFTPRCPYRREQCRDQWPQHEDVGPEHGVHCWIPEEERLTIRADLPMFKESAA